MKLCWLTDLHLNMLYPDKRLDFYHEVIKTDFDAILITGDIAEAPSLCDILSEMGANFSCPIYFVLGNHDYYYTTFAELRERITEFCRHNNKQLVWLNLGLIKLTGSTALVGVDGWWDGRFGDYKHTSVKAYDSFFIDDLIESKEDIEKLWQIQREFADKDAKLLKQFIQQALAQGFEKIIVATHVPPFDNTVWQEGRLVDVEQLPFFSSKATTDVLFSAAQTHPNIEFVVLSGHVHRRAETWPLENLCVKTGVAYNRKPIIQEIMDI